ncbi:MAG: spermidine/putrescine ABC transporter permease PotC, partial [Candidatus Chloroheliales bacterium]
GTQRSLVTVTIAHIVFNIPFVAVIVRARLHGFDKRLEEAAMDLGANELETFRRITLPLLMPGIIGGALMAFTLSIDDVIVTQFTAGPNSTTLPLKIYDTVKVGITPEVNAVSTLLLLASIVLVLGSLLLQREKKGK